MRTPHTLLTFVLACAVPAYAARVQPTEDLTRIAIPTSKENRIVRYTYSPDVIFRLFTVPTLHTHVELGEDEGLIEKPVAGDTLQWRISGGPRNLYIKPVRDDIETSMTVVTNKRTYQFQLISKKHASVYQKVSFDYPDRDAEVKMRQEAKIAKDSLEDKRLTNQIISQNVDPTNLDFSYEITGDAPFKPTAVYADDKFTYLRMPNTQDSPAVFLVDDSGNLSLVNYDNSKKNLIVVERVAKALLLKLGGAEINIRHRK